MNPGNPYQNRQTSKSKKYQMCPCLQCLWQVEIKHDTWSVYWFPPSKENINIVKNLSDNPEVYWYQLQISNVYIKENITSMIYMSLFSLSGYFMSNDISH